MLRAPAFCCDCAALPIPAIPRTSSSRPISASYYPVSLLTSARKTLRAASRSIQESRPLWKRYHLLLLRNHQAGDLLVRCLGQHFLCDQVGLLHIGAAVNDLLGVG